MNNNNTAVMIIDMQNKFMPDSYEEELYIEKHILLSKQKILLDFVKEYDLNLINLEYIGEGNVLKELKEKFSKKAITLPKYNNNAFIIVKDYQGRFSYDDKEFLEGDYGENLNLIGKLKFLGISNIILSGINKRNCMLSTFRAAIKRGYRCFTSDELMNFQKIFLREYDSSRDHYKTLDQLIEVVEQEFNSRP